MPPPDEPLQVVTTDIEALAVVCVLIQNLRTTRAIAARSAGQN